MITRFGMAPRLPGTTTAQFLEHWRTAHADAAGQIPGLRRYVQLHPVLVDGRMPLPYPYFDACSMLDFDDVESMEAGFASETYQGAVRDDEDQFIRKAGFSMVLAERRVLTPVPMLRPTVATFLRRHPAATEDEFLAVLTGPWLDTPGGTSRELALPVPGEREGREHNAADAVDLRGFDGVEEALDWLTAEDGGVAAALTLAGVVYGSATLVAQPHQVV